MTDSPTLDFPCAFPLKVMGRDSAQFRTAARAIVERHIGALPDTGVSLRASSEGTFLAITFTITAASRAQLDALYEELSNCPEILVAL